MSLPVLLAVPGPVEARLVAAWEGLRREVVVVRRCADLPEVLAAAGAGLARAAVLGADLPGADAEAVDALRRHGVGLLVLLPAGEAANALEHRWRALGARRFARSGDDPAALAHAVAAAAEVVVHPSGGGAAPAAPAPGSADGERVFPGGAAPVTGRTVAVWGPHGSTGRSTVAVNLAAELAATGAATVLADLDTRGACVAQLLGVLDDAPGLLAAVRAATEGRLDAAALQRHAALVLPDLAVLTGAPDPRRWSELRPVGLRRVLEVSAGVAEWVVVDLPGGLDEDEDGARDAAATVALEAADAVLVVGAADPVGLQRWIRAWQRLSELAPAVPAFAVVSRVRASAVGTPAPRRVAAVLQRFAGVADAVLLPEDAAADEAALAGRTLGEVAARSPLRQALTQLAHRLDDEVPVPPLPEVPDVLVAI
ncbi:P-loop NTPase [Paenibacillus sp. TRM 82003]|uniref:AAA family ATPase n=1 Tax=Kineococcus sp. TRM81007 TaxID=2925831 RepID=UPI001F560A1E|nr:P-loop NTPase [Kineococcus sp. TRM81007]MCI2237901.1 P-loop NTPase [Kineococcus sp. TRM81007]MCI3924631.1 P-loop NTPase [Paenibacillus sp. TRM 82003]